MKTVNKKQQDVVYIMSKQATNNSKEIANWCSDALHDLLGFADAALASYLVSVARKSKPPNNPIDEVVDILRGGGCTAPVDQVQSFARSLVDRIKGNGAALNRPLTNADLVKAAKTKYKLLDLDVPDPGVPLPVQDRSQQKVNEKRKNVDKVLEPSSKELKESKKRRYRHANSDSDR